MGFSEDSEQLLVRRAIKRDQDAFTCLYDKYVDRIYRYVYYRISDNSLVEDITQEVFIKAWRAIGDYKRTGAPFGAWLTRIAHNLVVDHYRASKNHVRLEEVEGSMKCTASDPADAAELDFDSDRVRGAILRLQGEKQKVILMRFIDGLSYSEVARALKKSEGAVRVIQYRALLDLRSMLTR